MKTYKITLEFQSEDSAEIPDDQLDDMTTDLEETLRADWARGGRHVLGFPGPFAENVTAVWEEVK